MVKLNDPPLPSVVVATVSHRPDFFTCNSTVRRLAARLPFPVPVVVWPLVIVDGFRLNDASWRASTGWPHGGAVPSARPVPLASSAPAKALLTSALPRFTAWPQCEPGGGDTSSTS